MEPWLVVWLVVGLTTTVALVALLAFLTHQVILLGRTAAAMQEELRPVTEKIAAASARAADAAARLTSRAHDRRKGGR